MTHLPHQQARRGKKGGVASGVARLALSADKREQAIELHKNGMKSGAIANVLQVHRNTISNWLNSAQ